MKISNRHYYKVYTVQTLSAYRGMQFHAISARKVSTQVIEEQPTEAAKVGNLSRSHGIQRTQERRDAIEGQFMRVAMKANRSQAQGDRRRAAR